MSDVFSIAKRSQVMGRIRGSGNRDTELRLLAIFRMHGIIGWRRNWRVFGRADFVFPKLRVAIFVDGCFWHGCPKHGVKPKNNAAFWLEKLGKNQARDRLVTRTLRAQGWKVVRIWEHELTKRNQPRLLKRLRRLLRLDPS